ncbi:MAG: hypothetical protein JWO36_3101 [Myxococcales bacterium]|nr:hypothetical protein [Myxococcales bacterium]
MVASRAMRRFGLLLAIVACRTSNDGPKSTVYAYAGDVPDPAATVIAHRPNGEVIDQVQPDAVGRAEVLTEADALVSVVFATADVTRVVTTLEPATGASVAIHGPTIAGAVPLIVGVIQIAPATSLTTNAGFEVTLGCRTVHVDTFPAAIEVPAPCAGSDANLDVLVRGYNSDNGDLPHLTVVGYAAARVPLIDGEAMFAPATWELTNPTVVPTVGVGGIVDLDWTLYADGLPFVGDPIYDAAKLWTGLTVDRARVHASIRDQVATSRVTTRVIAGEPTSLQFDTGDFLPALEPTLVLDDPARAAIHWSPANVGDAVDVVLSWQTASSRVTWNVVLPASASSITLPIDASTAPAATTKPQVLLRYLESSDLDGFDAVVRAGLFVEETDDVSSIVRWPETGQVREVRETSLF